ncbi:hypothetical protein EXIGLDRAFT_847962, partial [Exidia glandulosa HHB12029]
MDTDRVALLNATVTRRSRRLSAVSEPGICCPRVAASSIHSRGYSVVQGHSGPADLTA